MNFILIYQHIKIISCGKFIQIFKCVFKLNDVCKHHTTRLRSTHRFRHRAKRKRDGKSTLACLAQRASLNNSSVFYHCECVRASVHRKLETVMNCSERPPDINMMLKLKLKLMVCVRSICDLCAYYKMITLRHQMFIEVNQLYAIPHLSDMRNLALNSHTCISGWPEELLKNYHSLSILIHINGTRQQQLFGSFVLFHFERTWASRQAFRFQIIL